MLAADDDDNNNHYSLHDDFLLQVEASPMKVLQCTADKGPAVLRAALHDAALF